MAPSGAAFVFRDGRCKATFSDLDYVESFVIVKLVMMVT